MKYQKVYKESGNTIAVSREDALRTLLGSYKDTKEVRKFLDTPGEYPCMFSIIIVSEN